MRKIQIDLAGIVAGTAHESVAFDKTIVYADRIDMLRARTDVLSGSDRVLMQMYLEGSGNFGQMARLIGVGEATIARRIHRLMRKLIDGEYITCIRHRNKFTALERSLVKDYFVEGLSQKRIAQKRDVSVYRVRKCLRKMQEFIRVINHHGRGTNGAKLCGKKELYTGAETDGKGCVGDEDVRTEPGCAQRSCSK